MESNLSKKKEQYFKYAKKASEFSDNNRVNIGACLIIGHKVLNIGFNTDKTNPLQASIDRQYFNCECTGKIHAETMALYPFLKENIFLPNAILVTYRNKKDGSLGMSRPCDRCMQLIKKLGIKKLLYTTDNGFAEEKLVY